MVDNIELEEPQVTNSIDNWGNFIETNPDQLSLKALEERYDDLLSKRGLMKHDEKHNFYYEGESLSDFLNSIQSIDREMVKLENGYESADAYHKVIRQSYSLVCDNPLGYSGMDYYHSRFELAINQFKLLADDLEKYIDANPDINKLDVINSLVNIISDEYSFDELATAAHPSEILLRIAVHLDIEEGSHAIETCLGRMVNSYHEYEEGVWGSEKDACYESEMGELIYREILDRYEKLGVNIDDYYDQPPHGLEHLCDDLPNPDLNKYRDQDVHSFQERSQDPFFTSDKYFDYKKYAEKMSPDNKIPLLFRYIDTNGKEVDCLKKDLPKDAVKIDLFRETEIESIYQQAVFSVNEKQRLYDMYGKFDEETLSWNESGFYYNHSRILDAANEINLWRSKEMMGAKFFAELLKYEPSGCLGEYERIFNSLGVENSVPVLLRNLGSEDIYTRRMSAEILFKLELGKVGVSEKGVEYLGKLYDLGKFNDPDFFVRRLNNSGLIGILDEKEGKIEGVFPLDILSNENVITAQVRQLISQELFLPKADETPQQRQEKEQYLKLFIENYESIFNDEFFEGTNVRLNSLDLHEQGWFLLTYLELSEQGDKKNLERLKNFVTEYGEYGIKSFLALDYCDNPEVILEFAQCTGISDEQKMTIFKTYSQIEKNSYEYRRLFNIILPEETSDFGEQLHEAFIRNSSEFLLAATMIANGSEKEVTIQELIRGMEDIAKTMTALKHILEGAPNVRLVRNPQKDTEYDREGNRIKGANISFVCYDELLKTRTTVFIRPSPTVKVGNSYGGEARINIHTAHLDKGGSTLRESRTAVDLSDYGEYIGNKDQKPVLALDFCLDPNDPSLKGKVDELTRLLKSVPTYQGHHNEKSFSGELTKHFSAIASSLWAYLENNYPRKIQNIYSS